MAPGLFLLPSAAARSPSKLTRARCVVTYDAYHTHKATVKPVTTTINPGPVPPASIVWTDAPSGSSAHAGGTLVATVRKLGAGGWSAQWANGMKWDVSDQLKIGAIKAQSSRHFTHRADAKSAVASALLGYWREPLGGIDPDAPLTWVAPGPRGLQTWICLVGGRQVARISRQPAHGTQCSAAIDGWLWWESFDGATVLGQGAQRTPARAFPSVPAAKKAVAGAFKFMPRKEA